MLPLVRHDPVDPPVDLIGGLHGYFVVYDQPGANLRSMRCSGGWPDGIPHPQMRPCNLKSCAKCAAVREKLCVLRGRLSGMRGRVQA